MSRVEYMKELESLLSDIPAEEREDAINYYNDYFDAGGIENEATTIAALGSPEELAKTIKLANASDTVLEGEFTETGYSTGASRDAEVMQYDHQSKSEHRRATATQSDKKDKNIGTIVLIIILCIFACPIMLPIAFAILCVLFGVAIGVIGLMFGLGVAIIACGIGALFAGAVGIFYALMQLFTNPFGALVVMGFSLISLAIGLLFCLGCVLLLAKIVPPVIRWVVKVIRAPFVWISEKIKSRGGQE